MEGILIVLLIFWPLIFGGAAFLAPGRVSRNILVVSGGLLTMGLGLWALNLGPVTYTVTSWEPWGPWLAFGLEALEDVTIIYLGYRFRSYLIGLIGCGHLLSTLTEEVLRFRNPALVQPPSFVLDSLSMILVLIICLVGSLVIIYALSYMKKHQEHAPAGAGSERLFFLVLISFLGFMNGIVLADNIQLFIIFWEASTLCSFLLIYHDRTPEARDSAKRALLITAFGGLANMVASVYCLWVYQSPTLSGLMAAQALVPAALFCLGAMTKSALLPFQSWLLGAMVAPTPVSALLHSATMVKAGTYLILRLAPAFTNTRMMAVLALCGAFSFAVAAALAIGQSNAKKVLAYSTISNLGLIVACAALNRPLAMAAALMGLFFHAFSKGLLFLCVGTIEQKIGSRDIEDMGGIRYLLPFTTGVTLIGMASMLMPPFGMLLSKWMAIESAIDSPMILMLLVAGSALTVVFWVKWMGRIQTVSYHTEEQPEELPVFMRGVLLAMVLLVVILGVFAMPLNTYIFDPLGTSIYRHLLPAASSAQALVQARAVNQLTVWPILLILGVAVLAWYVSTYVLEVRHDRLPFLCGENVKQEGLFYSFYGAKDEPDTAWSASLYLPGVFNESRITWWGNLVAGCLVLSMVALVGL